MPLLMILVIKIIKLPFRWVTGYASSYQDDFKKGRTHISCIIYRNRSRSLSPWVQEKAMWRPSFSMPMACWDLPVHYSKGYIKFYHVVGILMIAHKRIRIMLTDTFFIFHVVVRKHGVNDISAGPWWEPKPPLQYGAAVVRCLGWCRSCQRYTDCPWHHR